MLLLNSRHELGGYVAFSGYIFDHDFSEGIVDELNDVQKAKLEASKNYHILATHSYADDTVLYSISVILSGIILLSVISWVNILG